MKHTCYYGNQTATMETKEQNIAINIVIAIKRQTKITAIKIKG